MNIHLCMKIRAHRLHAFCQFARPHSRALYASPRISQKTKKIYKYEYTYVYVYTSLSPSCFLRVRAAAPPRPICLT